MHNYIFDDVIPSSPKFQIMKKGPHAVPKSVYHGKLWVKN